MCETATNRALLLTAESAFLDGVHNDRYLYELLSYYASQVDGGKKKHPENPLKKQII